HPGAHRGWAGLLHPLRVHPHRQDVLRQPARRLRLGDGRRAVPHHRGVHARAEHDAQPAPAGAAVSAATTTSARVAVRSPWPGRLAIGAGVLVAVLLQLLPFYITVTSAMK